MEKSDEISVSQPSKAGPIVYIVDDDAELCRALSELFASASLASRSFQSSRAFLSELPPDGRGCILLDVRLPGLNGLALQEHLDRIGNHMPVIFMTGYGDIPMTVRALKAGAVDFLEKPFKQKALLVAVNQALAVDLKRAAGDHDADQVRELAISLTPREAEVMKAVVTGLLNKQIAFNLGIQVITVKLHRASVMRKMKAGSLADLVRKVATLDFF